MQLPNGRTPKQAFLQSFTQDHQPVHQRRRPWSRWIAPSLASLAIHAALGIVIGTVVIQTYMRSVQEPAPIEIFVDFDRPAPLAGSGPGSKQSADSATSANALARDDVGAATPARSTIDHVDEALGQRIAERLSAVNSEMGARENGARRGGGSNDHNALADEVRSRLGPPGGALGKTPNEPVLAPPASFAGLSATNALSIAYVVDASGSLISTLPVVRRELEASLRRLAPSQRFAVIFFQRNEALEPPAASARPQGAQEGRERHGASARPGLRPARPTEIDATLAWAASIRPSGRSNPLAALERALALRPDIIFLLSTDITGSGEFEIDRETFLRRLDELNPLDPETGRRPTRIQCVQFLDEDPFNTLRAVAEQHGGADGFRFLSRESLGLIAP